MIKVALLSCGRSDYSYYLPLLKKLSKDKFFDLNIIAFGTHGSQFYDRTVDKFYEDDFDVKYLVESLVLGDSSEAVSSSMGLTGIKFSSIWANNNFDLIICLGDRYEMFSAVSASIPFNIPIAHIGGGDTTLGAIDDKFRHSLTVMSDLHFTTSKNHADRVISIKGSDKGVFNVGALALDNILEMNLYTINEFKEKWGIDLDIPSVLVTFHPETVAVAKNIFFTRELCEALKQIDKQVIITMPNNDTKGTEIRNILKDELGNDKKKFKLVEVLGTKGYYTCLDKVDYILGNSSSGIIEAASFGKYVIDIGDRQKGRETGGNVFNVPAKSNLILDAVKELEQLPNWTKGNIYGKGNSSTLVVKIIKEFFEK